MDQFGTLARDLGFRPQGKAAPMSAARAGLASNPPPSAGVAGSVRSSSKPRSSWNSTPPSGPGPVFDDGLFSNHDSGSHDDGGYVDVFGGPPRWTSSESRANTSQPVGDFGYDSVFQTSKDSAKSSSLPVFDKPVYDDEIDMFEGVPGLKSSSSVKYDDVFASISSPAPATSSSSSAYVDLLGSFGSREPMQKGSSGKNEPAKESSGFDDLLPGFGGSSGGSKRRNASENNRVHQPTIPLRKSTSAISEDPFVVLESASTSTYSSSGLFTDPLEYISNPSISSNKKAGSSSVGGGILEDIDGFDGFTNSKKEKSFSSGGQSVNSSNAPRETDKLSVRVEDSDPIVFDMPTNISDSHVSANGSRSPNVSSDFIETDAHMSPRSDENTKNIDEIWLTVSEVPLFTQPTSAPPPARLPPKPPVSRTSTNTKKMSQDSVKSPPASAIDELDDFATGRPPRTPGDGWLDIPSSEEDAEANFAAAASAAAMKEAMDRAEAKFKYAKELREREKDAKAAKSRDSGRLYVDEKATQDAAERENKEMQERLEREQRERQEKEKEKEQRRIEREREEREKARRAVEMATREARERAAADARLRAERAAVEKANAEARQRAERAAVQRAAAEARDRAAAEAREWAAAESREKAAAEARERAEKVAAEARERAEKEKQAHERAAVGRAAAEVRVRAERAAVERAQAEARERAAAAARERQQKNENDLESFFGMGARPNSAPRQRTTSDPFDTQFQTRNSDAVRTSVGTTSNIRKASSTANIVDDLSSIFGAATSSAEFQEVNGESEERRKARYDRHLRTRERAAKALAEKNERDVQTLRDQEERHRIGETLDIEIKRWAAGKEGNLRALLSTLQYVLWPECGWQPVSLTDLITGASVKKVYRKATLCIHPDKVQQKGANIQQKYIAEKVFDLLKEAWNKFNSEELF